MKYNLEIDVLNNDDLVIYTIYHSAFKTEILGKILEINNETVNLLISNINPTKPNQILKQIPITEVKKYEKIC